MSAFSTSQRWAGLVCTILLALATGGAAAQSVAISFQGQLADGNVPATGRYDFVFRLFNAATGGARSRQPSSRQTSA